MSSWIGWLVSVGLVLAVAGVLEGLAWLDVRKERRREANPGARMKRREW